MDKPPCTPDCQRRSPTCHAECPDYAPYEAKKKAEREARMRAAMEEQDIRVERRVAMKRHYHGRRHK